MNGDAQLLLEKLIEQYQKGNYGGGGWTYNGVYITTHFKKIKLKGDGTDENK